MQQSVYNNPLFATGLSKLVGSYVGNAVDTARAEKLAAEAGNLNDTRTYREAIGKSGAERDLAGVLISALQAGKDFSGNAPTIASSLGSLAEFGLSPQAMANLQVGTGTQKAKDTFAGLNMALARRGGGGGGRRGGGGRSSGGKPRKMTASGRTALMKALPEGTDPSVALQIVADTEAYMGQEGATENTAIAAALQNLAQGPDEVTNPAGTTMSRMIDSVLGEGSFLGTNDPGTPDAVNPGPVTGVNFGGNGVQAAPAGSMPAPGNEAEFAALPPGTRFLAPDGTVRIK